MITKLKLPDCYGAEEIIMQEVKMVGKQKVVQFCIESWLGKYPSAKITYKILHNTSWCV